MIKERQKTKSYERFAALGHALLMLSELRYCVTSKYSYTTQNLRPFHVALHYLMDSLKATVLDIALAFLILHSANLKLEQHL